MRANIAVVTVSGKAYYRIVSQLKDRNIPFLSLIPGEVIPRYIKVIITTYEERGQIEHPNILVYNCDEDPSSIIEEAIRIAQNKERYCEVVIGVDPGKTFGLAVLGDGKVLSKFEGLSLEKSVDMVITELKNKPAKSQKIKVGDGVPELAKEIVRRLKMALPENVTIDIVTEAWTSKHKSGDSRKKVSDADSAVKIAQR
ncbi:MAG: hypothetical protein RMJ07_03065 [Nitrososphaerota archaeon]|nr:hypothetical protein [Candidatus Bathyarchaeota archaeon]MDW8048644.1 hypothetical protein [Nitrososphaerota archaeon]